MILTTKLNFAPSVQSGGSTPTHSRHIMKLFSISL